MIERAIPENIIAAVAPIALKFHFAPRSFGRYVCEGVIAAVLSPEWSLNKVDTEDVLRGQIRKIFGEKEDGHKGWADNHCDDLSDQLCQIIEQLGTKEEK